MIENSFSFLFSFIPSTGIHQPGGSRNSIDSASLDGGGGLFPFLLFFPFLIEHPYAVPSIYDDVLSHRVLLREVRRDLSSIFETTMVVIYRSSHRLIGKRLSLPISSPDLRKLRPACRTRHDDETRVSPAFRVVAIRQARRKRPTFSQSAVCTFRTSRNTSIPFNSAFTAG